MPLGITRNTKTNWERLSAEDESKSIQFRDPKAQQQIGRSDMEAPQTPFTRVLATFIFSILVAVVLWLLVSFFEMAAYWIPRMTGQDFAGILSWSGSASGLPGYRVFLAPSVLKLSVVTFVTTAFFAVVYSLLMRNLAAQNAINDTTDINQYPGDQHLALNEEIQDKFDIFPDVGAHSSVLVSSMISHMALINKGLDKVLCVDRKAEKGDDSEFYSIIAGDTEDLTLVRRPWIDRKFQEALYEASGVPERFRGAFDPTKVAYNPGNKKRNKLKGYDTWADVINGDWELPLYEPQRPAGVFIVDTEPVNTMVLAITRAGKGQTVIEPTIDMWLREKRPNNIVVNDPKGELLVKNYVPATVRGFQPVQFNLINALKTDIYNPLAMAAQAAREGDSTKCALYVENIADVFFPLDGGEDPVWPNAANNAFKRAAYGLIDYYMEEEREIRNMAEKTGMDAGVLETRIDALWGKVTLYNCYQLFVQLTARKQRNPAKELADAVKEGKLDDVEMPEYHEKMDKSERMSEFWNGADEIDELTLYFAATEKLPMNSIRSLVSNANNALKSMGAAEKMLASVYGIAVTAMSFFTDPTISTLTSGTPSQNVDLAGLSFPRRIGVRLHPEFCKRYHLIGLQARWQAYGDPEFKQDLGPKFYHEDLVSREGWARFYFEGIFEDMEAWLKLELVNPTTGVLVKTFYFHFKKDFQKSLDGRYYITDPILDQKVIKDGVLTELRPMKNKSDGKVVYRKHKLRFKSMQIEFTDGGDRVTKAIKSIPAITQIMVRYAEKPKIVFLVTPPHLMKYAKLILILIKQLVDLNFDQSYMTKSSQKPLYKTRFMLDELGNLQSEGHGIGGFETMLSIGLGQDQQFTLILQTLQQLRDVYGESVDKIVQGNAQPLYSKIATPTGWKRMGDMQVGDAVLTPSGKTTQVTGVYPRGVRKVYKVIRRDGSSCLCCNEHLWKVKVG